MHTEVCFPHETKQKVFKFRSHAQSHSPLFLSVSHSYKEKMVTPKQKAFSVLQFAKYKSVVSLLRAFRQQFQSDPLSANSMRHWYQQFQTAECLCERKSAGYPHVSEESVDRVRQCFLCSPKKSVHHTSCELEMSTMTVWRVLRKRLEMKPYCLHLLQFLQSLWYTVYAIAR
jgi:hypothetical protein